MTPDRLQQMFDMQRRLQEVMPPIREFPSLDSTELMDQLRIAWMGLVTEIGEALAETGWKPWATSNHINGEAFRAEMVDAWHFFMNMCMLGGMTPDDLYHGYMRKHKINRERQANGYDGVSTKCPVCHAAYDDPGVQCGPGVHVQPEQYPGWLPSWNRPTDPLGLPAIASRLANGDPVVWKAEG